jgi:bacillopeptidase F
MIIDGKTMKKITTVILACVVTLIGAGLDARGDVIGPDLREVLQALGADEEVAVIVTLADTVDLKKFKDKDKALRRSKIIKALKNKSVKTQKNIKNYLKLNKVRKIKSFWIFNGLALTANAEVLEELAGMDEIESISLDVTLSKSEPPVTDSVSSPEWNINLIKAPELWSSGHTGTGTVLASMDTGVDVNHPDIVSRWRGGSNSWYDPNGEHATPYDGDTWGHGTGVMGVMVGGDAGGSSIGVAPGAKWIAVKIFNDAGLAALSGIHAGYQWLLDPDGDPDTDDAPDVVNNSWGFPDQAGTCSTYFQSDIVALKTAGIGVVFSAGNQTVNESPANNLESFAVGAVDATEIIAFFSARGASACDGTIYPELVAPGVNVLTADLTFDGRYPDSYATVNGTSIAAPHVTGAMALLLSAYPSLSIAEIETALTTTALDLGEIGPDNTYGNGLLNVMAAYNLLSQNRPKAHNDRDTIPRNKTAIINILANDVHPNGTIDATSVVLKSATTIRGSAVVVESDGTVTYTPEGGGGPDYFWYTVKDTEGVTSNEARVRINRVRGE